MRTNNWAFLISRSIYDSEIWQKPSDWLKIWIHILGNVNYQDNNLFKRWQNLFRYDLVAIDCWCSYKSVENCMKFLKDRNQIGITRTARWAIISVNKYDDYQTMDKYKESNRNLVGIKQESSSDSIIEEGNKGIKKEDTTTTATDLLLFFNSTTWVNLKLTDKKKEQIKNRLKTFSIEEIRTAIKNRMTSKWHIDNGWTKDWDSLFCNDEKIDKMLNIQWEAPIKKVKRTFDFSTWLPIND